MRELGFEQIKFDPGIFLYKRKGSLTVVVIVYVDDAVFCGPSKAIIDKIKGHFMRKWECQDLGEATEFLYMYIKCHSCYDFNLLSYCMLFLNLFLWTYSFPYIQLPLSGTWR